MEEIQGLTDLQLQEADEEKERILAQLQELEKKVGKTRKKTHESLLPGPAVSTGAAERAVTHGHLWLHWWRGGGPRDGWMQITGSGA